MKTLPFFSHRRNLGRLLACVISSLVLISASVRAQDNTVTVISEWGPDACSLGQNVCCQVVTIAINKVTTFAEFDLTGSSLADPNCLDSGCAALTFGLLPASAYSHMVIQKGNPYRIQIIPDGPVGTDTAHLWPGDTIQFTICSKWIYHGVYCYTLWDHYNWQTNANAYPDSTNANDLGGDELGWCGKPTAPCSTGCDKVTHQHYGNVDYFCVTRSGGTIPATGIVINFTPPLQPCDTLLWDGFRSDTTLNYNGGSGGPDTIFFEGKRYILLPGGSVLVHAPEWWQSDSLVTGGTQIDTISAEPGHFLYPCGTFCFYIKMCPIGSRVKHTVTIWTLPGDTTGCPSTHDSDSFKQSGNVGQPFMIGNGEPNYPNPFGEGSGFKTTIPFTTPSKGKAKITVFDEVGKVVTVATMDALGAGRHFFYFAADQLPAGKYFYNIEFPEGVVINHHSMLLVR